MVFITSVILDWRIREVFIRVSKSNWFCISTLHDCLKKTRATFSSNQSKTKTNRNSLAQVFPRFTSAHVFTTSFNWFNGLSVSFVIGQSDHFGFRFTILKFKTAIKPITSRTKTNRQWFTPVFPRFSSATCICLAF